MPVSTECAAALLSFRYPSNNNNDDDDDDGNYYLEVAFPHRGSLSTFLVVLEFFEKRSIVFRSGRTPFELKMS